MKLVALLGLTLALTSCGQDPTGLDLHDAPGTTAIRNSWPASIGSSPRGMVAFVSPSVT